MTVRSNFLTAVQAGSLAEGAADAEMVLREIENRYRNMFVQLGIDPTTDVLLAASVVAHVFNAFLESDAAGPETHRNVLCASLRAFGRMLPPNPA